MLLSSNGQQVKDDKISRHISASADFKLYPRGSRDRQQLEAYISNKYESVHKAVLTEFLPLLLTMETEGEVDAVVGLSLGGRQAMFLEQYLDGPIEQKIAYFEKRPVDRNSIVEIGNLAIANRGTGLLMFIVVAMMMSEAGYNWMAFTATQQVSRLIHRLGFEPRILADANSGSLVENAECWGSYYDQNPRVMIGSLNKATVLVDSNPFLSEVVGLYSRKIAGLVKTLATFSHDGL